MRVLREAVRYGYAPFMMFGLTGAAYWVVANGHSYFWLAPLLASLTQQPLPPSGSHPSLKSGTITPRTATRRPTCCT